MNQTAAQRLAASAEAKFAWHYGGQNLLLQWSSAGDGAWRIASTAAEQGAAGLYRARDNASNPVLVPPRVWEFAANATGHVRYLPETRLRVQCVATPEEFSMRAAVRELVSFGFNFYGELGRSENVLELNGVSTPSVVQSFGGSGDAEYVDKVSLGCNHGLAVSKGGVWSWGSNAKGQLGRSQAAGTAKPSAEPEVVTISGLDGQGAEVDDVASGGSFSLVRVRGTGGASQLYSAGSNRFGQLGRATVPPAGVETFNPSFERVDLSEAILSVAAGRHHAIARTASGLYSWGANRYGQLGRATNAGEDLANPTPLRILPNYFEMETPMLVALGRFHSVVVTSEGNLFCFGSNLRGQCGPTAPDQSFQPGSDRANAVPRKLSQSLIGNEAVAAVAAGQYSTMLLTRGGKVWGFGRNFYGQLSASAGGVGLGTPISSPQPLDISALRNSSDIVRLVVGADHTLMIFADDGHGGAPDLIGLGSNEYGQLGTAEGVGGRLVEPVMTPPKTSLGCSATFGAGTGVGECATGYMRAIDLSVGCDQTVVVTERPQCPAGTNSSSGGLQPCSVCPGGTYQPAAGASTCLECAQGLFSYAGSTACLTCGNGTNTTAARADETGCLGICAPGQYGVQQVVGLQGLEPCQPCAVDTYSDQHGSTNCTACPALHGSVRTGLSAAGQCRRFCDEGSFSVDGLEVDGACTQCPAGKHQGRKRSTTCLLCPVGKFAAMGSSSCTDCARGSFSDIVNASTCSLCDYGTYQSSVAQTACLRCRPDKSTDFLGATNESDCKTTVFQVWGVGNNLWGQLGSGWVLNSTAEVNTKFVEVANNVGNPRRGLNNEQVLAVSAGFSHTLFLTTEGYLWAAGQNIYGQLGHVPAAGSACNYADEHDLVCRQDPHPNAVPRQVNASYFGGRLLQKAAAGRHFSVVLTADWRVYSWGYNRYGQLGRSDNVGTDAPNWQPQEVVSALWAGREMVDVAVGSYHVLVLASDGTVFSFGLNRHGQLGRATNAGLWAYNWQPAQIPPSAFGGSLVAVGNLSAGAVHSLVLSHDGHAWAFGSNGWGQLGSPENARVWGGFVATPFKAMEGVVQVAAGGKHSVLRTWHGKLYGFGSNYYGQLASRTAIGDSTFTPVPIVAPVLDKREFYDVQAGGDNTIVQTVNGTERVMWLFGSNRYGQLGVQENAGEWDFNPDPRALTTCQLMGDEFCGKYTTLSSSVGSGFAMIQTGAKVCPKGSIGPPPYGRPGTAGSCQPCATGTYAASEGSTVCLACGPGRFALAGSSACTRCARGTYSGAAETGACTACPAGKTMAEETNRTSASECLQICQPGQAATGTVNGVGAGVCTMCEAGKFNDVDGATHCSHCPRATFSTAHASSCTACPAGTTTYPHGGVNSSECVALCAAGSYSVSGGGSCTLCGVGKYNTAPGATACSECPAGFSTAVAGSIECLGFCEPGTYGSQHGLQPCSECPAGKHAAGSRASECDACPSGTFSEARASLCTVCAPGYSAASPSSPACAPCPPGTLQANNGSTMCHPCPQGYFASEQASTQCHPCPPGLSTQGETGAAACTPCPDGTALRLASGALEVSSCDECPPGSFAKSGDAECTPCPIGSFSDEGSASACTVCAFGTTLRVGANSSALCVAFADSVVTLGVCASASACACVCLCVCVCVCVCYVSVSACVRVWDRTVTMRSAHPCGRVSIARTPANMSCCFCCWL